MDLLSQGTMHPMENSATLIHSLNEQQQAAVSAPPSNLLVLAGAGSGKTRVLVHRIAWLIQEYHISPHEVLAVTFTNKAAHEMRGRIESLLGLHLSNLWVGTFHGLSHRLLRTHWEAAGLPEAFQILDSDDQYRLVRRILKNLELDETKWPPKQAQWFINKQKESGRRAHQVQNYDGGYFAEVMTRVYHAYETLCDRSGLVDFTELLLRSLELLQKNDDIRQHYQKRFRHILVDEFQDTNKIQYEWLRLLTADDSFIMAVGDDDQSIYSWRGACVENIDRFMREYTEVTTIRLEQNYRSTQTILNAANAVIANNENRMGKNLWTDGNTGAPITIYSAFNERDEAHFIASSIQQWIQQHRAKDIAILYRSNAQSRVLEEQLIDQQIPYRIYGGLRFFERAEIKDAIAYLRLIANRSDDPGFERIVNLPTRGIGNTTLTLVRTTARDLNLSLWESSAYLIENEKLSARASNALKSFLALIDTIDKETTGLALNEQTEEMLNKSGLLAHYKKDKTEKGLSRVENLEELLTATTQFEPDENDKLSPLAAFLSHVALEAGEEQSSQHTDCVSLMTLHAAKGLEFPLVFMCGMEEDLFPHKMSVNEPGGLEEERRLCYVGMTRAMEKLVITYAESRRLYGSEKYCQASRFIDEIPEECMHSERPTTKISRPQQFQYKKPSLTKQAAGDSGLEIGQRVKHKKFGSGTIINYEGQGEHTRIQVKFDRQGAKWLVASYAKLEPIF